MTPHGTVSRSWLLCTLATGLLALGAGITACGGSSDASSSASTSDSTTTTTTTTTTTDSSSSGSTSTTTTGSSTTGTTTTSTDCSASTTQGAKLLCLATAFRATLSSSQLASVSYTLSASNATQHWSNLPVSIVARNGLALSSLGSTAKAAAEALLTAALSTQGQTTATELRAADGVLANYASGYGQDLYYISFLGTPSATSPWILQFTGHHYTVNISVNSSNTAVSATPMFVGVEPTSWTASDGSSHAPMASRRNALLAMLQGLDATQLATAKLSQAYDDLLVPPQKDGKFPSTAQGLSVSALSDAQRALVKAAILSYAGDEQGNGQAEAYTTDEALKATTIAWASVSDLATRGSYVRIDGPSVWIEFSVQGGIVFNAQNHYHSIWRDKQLDYGGNFSF
ncbi:DUF3500 domain-containing protein [uncultured Aquincola sp.]|uniref:DUF3500 domain-containing protein n=1 Tax=uncultured Aquincola sp. TaxID=886556 RepID=UPI0032B23510